jgi:mannose-6-phosphate isomerase-like protein (cupin superfamily)
MPWHSTEDREELLIALAGRVHIEAEPSNGCSARIILKAGECAWLPSRTPHTVHNRSRNTARYLYVTGR